MNGIKKIIIITLLFSFSCLLSGNNFIKPGTGYCDYNGDSINDYFIDLNKNGVNDNDERMFNLKSTLKTVEIYIKYIEILENYLKTPSEKLLKEYLEILNRMYSVLGIYVGRGRTFRDSNYDGINDAFIDINGDGRNDMFPHCRNMGKRRRWHMKKFFHHHCINMTPEVLQDAK